MKFHTISGLPRSGSTLLCNIFNQNPDFHASSTSALSTTLGTLNALWSQAPEIKSDLAADKVRTEQRIERVLRAVVLSWCGYTETIEPDASGCGDVINPEASVIFDKSRGWITIVDTLHKLFPDSRCICMVRDPRHVFASVQRHHQEFPLLSDTGQATVFARADAMFSPQGIVGGPLTHFD